MLSRLSIKNLVIVRELELEFAPGMSALTGETGAGKSIMIDALGLTLGDKTDNGMIRAGCDKAGPGPAAKTRLKSTQWIRVMKRGSIRDGR